MRLLFLILFHLHLDDVFDILCDEGVLSDGLHWAQYPVLVLPQALRGVEPYLGQYLEPYPVSLGKLLLLLYLLVRLQRFHLCFLSKLSRKQVVSLAQDLLLELSELKELFGVLCEPFLDDCLLDGLDLALLLVVRQCTHERFECEQLLAHRLLLNDLLLLGGLNRRNFANICLLAWRGVAQGYFYLVRVGLYFLAALEAYSSPLGH